MAEKGIPSTFCLPPNAIGYLHKKLYSRQLHLTTWKHFAQEADKEDLFILENGGRYSTEAMRTLLLHILLGISEDRMKFVTGKNPPAFYNALLYSDFTELFELEDINDYLNTGGANIEKKFSTSPEDLVEYFDISQGKVSPLTFGSLEQLYSALDAIRERDSEMKVLLSHGKWNSIPPHYGHILHFKDLAEQLSKKGVDDRKCIFLVGCESNKYILSVGGAPNLTTAWRTSFMTKIPYVDWAFAIDPFTLKELHTEWPKIYKRIAPDFISLEKGHPFSSWRISNAEECGAEILYHERPTTIPKIMKVPNDITSKFMQRHMELGYLSSTLLNEYRGSKEIMDPLIKRFFHLRSIKEMRKELYGDEANH